MPGVKAIRNPLLLVLFLLVLMNTQVYAELSPLLGDENFEDSLSYSAEWYRVTVPGASAVLSANGITFSGEGDSSVSVYKDRDFFTLSGWNYGECYIEHVPSSDSSAGEGLVIHFDYPVSRFGIKVANGHISDTYYGGRDGASLTAFTASGEPAGTVNVDAENQGFDNFWLTYSTFGFEVSDDSGVTTIVVDYGEAELPETLSIIYYEYQEPRPFKVIFPQIAQGSISGAGIECDLNLFWDRSVTIKTLSLSGEFLSPPILDAGSEFTLASEPVDGQNHFKSTTIPGGEELTVGYVVAESDYPLDGQVVYRTTDADGKVYEADIRACTGGHYLKIPFELNQAENLNAALAIVNPANVEAEIEIHVHDAVETYTERGNPPTFTLQAGEQRALFMWELWNEMPSEDGNYILELRSTVPFAASAFYTRNWIVVGNLPVWSYKEGQAR